jgi:hypothetical protein
MQPLDRSVFGPLKTYYNKACDSMMMAKPGKPLTIYDISKLAGIAFPQAMSKNNITKGFEVTGIWPYNEDIFEDHEFLSSFVTDRPNPQEIDDHLKPSGCNIQPLVPNIIEKPKIQTPEEVRPFPKAEVRKLASRRRKGSSKILTDSLVKKSLEDEALRKASIKKKKEENAISRAKKNLKLQAETDNNDLIVHSCEHENIKVSIGKYVLVKFATKKDSLLCRIDC